MQEVKVGKLVIAGHSHMTCLGVPLVNEERKLSLYPIDYQNMTIYGLYGVWPRTDEYWNYLKYIENISKVYILYAGNQHNSGFTFELEQPVDFVLASNPQLELDFKATIIPETLIRSYLEPSFTKLIEVVQSLKAKSTETVILGTPPPKEDNEKISKVLKSERHFRNIAARLKIDIESIKLTRPILRLKLWNVIQEMLRDISVAHDCEFIPVPSCAQSRQGFLREEYWYSDATHANSAYGKLVLEVIINNSINKAI